MGTAVSIAAALGCGLWLGVTGRVAMRIVALDVGLRPGLSAGGTAEVVAFGTLLGTPVALALWWLRRRLSLPAGTGLLVGLALFAVLALIPPPAARSALAALSADHRQAAALPFAVAFVSYGAWVDVCWHVWFRCISDGHAR
jgi:hypothetical protein